jgi:hypothetical protein
MPAFRTVLISASVLTASVLSVALTGCQPSSSAASGGSTAGASSVATTGIESAGSSATTSAAGTPSTASAAPAQGKLAGVPSACPSAGEVMSALGLSKLVVHGADPSFCEYLYQGNKADPSVVITFNVAPADVNPSSLGAALKSAQANVKAVPGLGDAAYSWGSAGAGGSFGLSFLSGGTLCSITTVVPTTLAGRVALARWIIAG